MEKPERKYVEFTHSFTDPWLDDQEVCLHFHFAKPNRLELKRLQDKAVKDSAQAARNLLLDIIQPAEKQKLMEVLEEYPGVATSFSTAIIKGVGISSELGN